jgi:thiol-disulfide isomerase/thioredoxin
MSNTVNLIFDRFIRPYSFLITLIVVGGIFTWVAYYVYKNYNKRTEDEIQNDIANASSNGKIIQIFMFHVDWCPHCKTALPEWKLFAEAWDGKQNNGYVISCTQVDCTEDDSPKIKNYLEQYNVDSFPTVKAVMGDNIIDFDAKVTNRNLEKFLKSVSA